MKGKLVQLYKKYYFCIIPLLIFGLFYFAQDISFSRNDDVFMQNLALSFETNVHSEQLMYMSVILGYALRFLYLLMPAINWFAIAYIVPLLAAYFVIYKVICEYNDLIKLAIVAITQVYVITNVTFSIIAFLCCAAGMILFLGKVDSLSKKNIIYVLLSALLIFTGFAIRGGQVFLFVFIAFIPLELWCLKSKKNSISTVVVLVLICVITNYSLSFANQKYDSQIPAELYYTQFQENRSRVTDQGSLSYDEHKEYFDNLGISENDVEIAKSFFYGSKEVFSNETMGKIADSKTFGDLYELNPILIIRLFSHSQNNILFLFFTVIVALICLLKNKKEWLFTLLVVGADLSAILYLSVIKRPVERIVVPVLIIGMIMALYLCKDVSLLVLNFKFSEKGKKLLRFAALALIFALVPLVFITCEYYNSNLVTDSSQTIEEYLNEQTEGNLYVSFEGHCNYRFSDYNLRVLRKNIHNYRVEKSIIGDTGLYTYYWYDKLSQYGLTQHKDNILGCLLDDNVYYICKGDVTDNDNLDLFVTYFAEHYSTDVGYKAVKTFDNDDLSVFKFYVK